MTGHHRGSVSDRPPDDTPAVCAECGETEDVRWWSPEPDIAAVAWCVGCLWGVLTGVGTERGAADKKG